MYYYDEPYFYFNTIVYIRNTCEKFFSFVGSRLLKNKKTDMLHFLPSFILGPLSLFLFILNLIFWMIFLTPIGLIKQVLPEGRLRNFLRVLLTLIVKGWIDVNTVILWITQKVYWDVQGMDGLPKKTWLILVSNHRSWVDIIILQKFLNHRLPFLKFFLKQELRKVPLLGFAWHALDYPFMKRYTSEEIAVNPDLKGKDLEAVREGCKKFKTFPVTIITFPEGTRFSEKKQEFQKSPYKNLLKPKAGGLAYVMTEMTDFLAGIVNVTILYSPEKVEFWDLLSGRVKKVVVRVEFLSVPGELTNGDYDCDVEYRQKFQEWLNDLWEEKNGLIEKILS